MNKNPKYTIYHDLIGYYVYAKPSSKKNESFKDIGLVIDDTKNMLTTKKDNIVKKYIKKNYTFRIMLPKEQNSDVEKILEVNGTKIVGRPENRLRSLRKKR